MSCRIVETKRTVTDLWILIGKRFVVHTVTLHNLEELDDDLGRRSDQDLALASLLGVVDGVERIVEDGSADHFGGVLDEILKSGREMRYLPRSMLAFQRLPERGECPQRSIARVLPPIAEEEKRIEGIIVSP